MALQSQNRFAKVKGLSRFVWICVIQTMPGVPGVRIEGSFTSHKAPPGKYQYDSKMVNQTVSPKVRYFANPLYATKPQTYMEYHQTMSGMESELTSMHRMINRPCTKKQKQLESFSSLPTGIVSGL